MRRVDTHLERIFSRTTALLDSIDSGEPPEKVKEHVEKINRASSWDIIGMGQASILDLLDAEAKEDGVE